MQGSQGTSGSPGEPGRDGNDVSTCINESIIECGIFFYGKVREDLCSPLKRVPYNNRRAKFEGDISLKLRKVGKIYRHWYGGDNFVTPTIKFNFVCKISRI